MAMNLFSSLHKNTIYPPSVDAVDAILGLALMHRHNKLIDPPIPSRFGNFNEICSNFNRQIFLFACKDHLFCILYWGTSFRCTETRVWSSMVWCPLSCRALPVVNWESLDILLFVSFATSYNSSMYDFWSKSTQLWKSSGLVTKLLETFRTSLFGNLIW